MLRFGGAVLAVEPFAADAESEAGVQFRGREVDGERQQEHRSNRKAGRKTASQSRLFYLFRSAFLVNHNEIRGDLGRPG